MGRPKSSYSTAIVAGAAAGGEGGVGLAGEAAAGGVDLGSGGSSLAVESFPLFAEAAEVAGTSSSFPAAMTENLFCPYAGCSTHRNFGKCLAGGVAELAQCFDG